MNDANHFSIFKQYPKLRVVMSTSCDGNMKYSFGEDSVAENNRKRFLGKNNIQPDSVISTRLVHGNHIKTTSLNDRGNVFTETDGLILKDEGVYGSVTVADCLPIVVYDSKNNIASLLHAGWKGLESGIITHAIQKMIKDFSSDPINLSVGIGPGIGVCHFEIQENLQKVFSSYDTCIEKRDGKAFLDIKKVAAKQLVALGVKEQNIEINSVCTYCSPYFYFSHRRDQIDPIQAMMMVVGLEQIN